MILILTKMAILQDILVTLLYEHQESLYNQVSETAQ